MKSDYSPLNLNQINDFLERNNVDALDIQDIGNYTVILYQTLEEQGDWRLTSDQNGMISASHGYSNNNSDIAKVSVGFSKGGGRGIGNISYISLIINDNEILEAADRLVVNNKNHSSEELVNNRRWIIISDFEDESSEELIITLLDKTGNMLFCYKRPTIGNKVIDKINDLKKGSNSMQNAESQCVLKHLPLESN